jgi:high-affinity iron transporter
MELLVVRRRARAAVALLLSALACLASVGVALASPQDDLRGADRNVEAALAALERGDVAGARVAYAAFDAGWGQIEDGIRATDRGAYRAIEAGMRDAKVALGTEPVDVAAAREALVRLHGANDQFLAGRAGVPGPITPAAERGTPTEQLQGLLVHLDEAHAAVGRQDGTAALGAVRAFQDAWPTVEGSVRAKSPSAYTATENDMAEAQALLASSPPRLAEADAVLVRMRERLAPIVEAGASYGVFDAFIIMLREGLEALLVVSALLAFLAKSRNGDKQGWIWGGAGLGAVLSVGLALVLQQAFSRAGVALGSELLEGVVGLAAAAMLFYMSYWLHAKAQLGAWQRYIHDKSTAALASGSMLSLAAIATLAVLREGAETTVFYLGIAPSIVLGDLALGLVLGVVALIVVGAALVALGGRLPVRPFFLASSALIYYLGFKFVGTSLHALQVAGVLPATPAPVPASDVLGIFPTWETALAQVVLLAVAVAVVWATLRHAGRRGSPLAGPSPA